MAEQKEFFNTLSILRDDPLFWGAEAFDPGLDAFNHAAYARAIFKILSGNRTPLSIGLFGPWGIGKSTIISILFKLILESENSNLKAIYFNAWKYSGDSFRRQFLIEVAKQVYQSHPDCDAVVRRLEQLNYTDVLREANEQRILDKVSDILTFKGVTFKKAGLARLLFAGIVVIIGTVLSLFAKSFYPLVAGLLSAVVAFLMGLKFEDVFVVQETSVYDPKIIFPEQFEAEFRKLINSSGPLGTSKAVIVIDDIDRCESPTIRDILVSVKTFVGHENCFFIVPCDDKSIVQVFQDPNQKTGYEDELLRKYFNVGVRIAPLMATDLVDFANEVSKRTNMPPSVVQIAILANYRDARKMKHFLNTFSVKYAIAKARKESGFMPVDIDQNLSGFAKAVLIEDLFPGLFSRMVEHPEIYGVLERSALGGNVDSEIKKLGLENWEKDYGGLRAILEKTRDVRIQHVEVFLSLKTTNPEARIPRGFELKNSIVQGDYSATEEIIRGIVTDESRSSLAQLLIDLLNSTTDTFLKNTIAATVNWCFKEDFFAEGDKSRIASTVSQTLVYNDGQKVLQQPAPAALRCAQKAGEQYEQRLASKYLAEIANLDQPPDSISETINVLYTITKDPAALSEVLNNKLEKWANTANGLSLMLQIVVPDGLSDDQKCPSISLVEKIAGAMSTDIIDAAIGLNKLRRQVVFKNWNPKVAPTFATRLITILQQSQSDSTYSPRIQFVVQTVIEKPECLDPDLSPPLWGHLQATYNRFGDPPIRAEIHGAVLVFAATCPHPSTRQAARSFALQNWQSFNEVQLKDAFDFLTKVLEESGRELRSALIQQDFGALQNELQNPTERSKQRLAFSYENRSFLPERAIDDFLVKTLESQDPAFAVWSVVVGDYSSRLGEEFCKKVVDKCLSLITNAYAAQRRQGFVDLIATVLPGVSSEMKPAILPVYFALCKHSDHTIRNSASTILSKVRKGVDEQDFKLALNPFVRELCRMTPAEVSAFRAVLDSALQHSPLFGNYEWRDLADLAKRMLTQADPAIQEYGASLVERIPSFPAEHEEDLIHVLVSLAKGTNASLRERADKVLRRLPLERLGSGAHRNLEEYLSPPQVEEKNGG